MLAYILAHSDGHSGEVHGTADTRDNIITITFSPPRADDTNADVTGHTFEFAVKPGKRRVAQIPDSFTTPQYTAHLRVPPRNTAVVELHYKGAQVGQYVRTGAYKNVPLFDTMYIDSSNKLDGQ